jgi:hypothetical protein
MSEAASRQGKGGRVTLSDIGEGLRNAAARNPATQRLVEEGQA